MKNLTTSERLTLLEQIFVPQGGATCAEFASCTLSDMDFLFDFWDVNLVEMKWSGEDVGFCELTEKVAHLISPEQQQELMLGMPYLIHVIVPQDHTARHEVVGWLKHDEPFAMEHFLSVCKDTKDITLRIVFIENEIGDKIYEETFNSNRFLCQNTQ